MLMRIIEKIYGKDRKVNACKVMDEFGRVYIISKKDLRNFEFVNAKITKDLRIIPCHRNIMTLYHGSHTGINGEIQSNKSRETCDFGKAFYLGELKQQAEEIIIDDTCANSAVYTIQAEMGDLQAYEFNSSIEWALYIGVKRGYIDTKPYKKLSSFVGMVDSYDVVIGSTADDRMAYVFRQFVAGSVTDVVLINCLKYIKLGRQFAFKTAKACKRLRIIKVEHITQEKVKEIKHNKDVRLNEMSNTVENIIKAYRRQGGYIDEILEALK